MAKWFYLVGLGVVVATVGTYFCYPHERVAKVQRVNGHLHFVGTDGQVIGYLVKGDLPARRGQCPRCK